MTYQIVHLDSKIKKWDSKNHHSPLRLQKKRQ